MAKAENLYQESLVDFREGREDEACQKLAQAILAQPDYEDAYEGLAVILYNLKNYDESMGILKKWIEVNPNAVMAHTNLSRCYMSKGMIQEAEDEQALALQMGWRESAGLDPKDETPKVDYMEKIERYKKVIDLDPQDVLGYFSLGNAYLDAYKKQQAVDTFKKAVEVDSKHSSSYYGLGQAYEAMNQFQEAKTIYQKGIQVADEQGDIMTQRKMESRIRTIEKRTESSESK